MIRQIDIKQLPIRSDPAGDGKFGASRGDRAHTGVDYVCTPGEPVLSPVEGTVSRLGFAYATDLQWRIVDIRANTGYLFRLFYVSPLVKVGDEVNEYTVVGLAQNIADKYPDLDMLPHIHAEIKDEEGNHINPETWRFSNAAQAGR